nr:hypothetical protein [Candidatus Sigynarchaeota archaeon]
MGKFKPADILIIIGGIVGLILGVLSICTISLWWIGHVVWSIIFGLIAVILCIGILDTYGIIPNSKLKFTKTWVVMLIVGLIIFAPTGNIGGLLVIIGAIMMIFT